MPVWSSQLLLNSEGFKRGVGSGAGGRYVSTRLRLKCKFKKPIIHTDFPSAEFYSNIGRIPVP